MKLPDLLKHSLTITQKITSAGVLMILAMVFQKILAINYIAVIPFLRISFGGPAIIILASVWLGPIYGLMVGLGSDVLGYFLLDPKHLSFFPQITAIYSLLGLVSYFIFLFTKRIKNKAMLIVEATTMLAVLTFVGVYLFVNEEIKLYSSTYVLELWQKFLIVGGLLLLFVVLFAFILIFNKKRKGDEESGFEVYQISFSCFVIEIVVMILFGTTMKGAAFGFATYPMILVTQIITLFINVPLNTVLITFLSRIIEQNHY